MEKAVFLKDTYLLPGASDAIEILINLNYQVFNVCNPVGDNEPKLTIISELTKKHRIDLRRSFTVGESGADIAAGRLAGTRTILIIDQDEVIPVIEVDNVVFSLIEAVEWIMEISQAKELSLN
jgi:hypothetical protein